MSLRFFILGCVLVGFLVTEVSIASRRDKIQVSRRVKTQVPNPSVHNMATAGKVSKSGEIVYCSLSNSTCWVDASMMAELYQPKANAMTGEQKPGSKAFFKLWSGVERLLKNNLDDKAIGFTSIILRGNSAPMIEIQRLLEEHRGDDDANTAIQDCMLSQTNGEYISVALAVKLLRQKMMLTKDVESSKTKAQRILQRLIPDGIPDSKLGYNISTGMSQSSLPFEALRESCLKNEGEKKVGWAHASLGSMSLDCQSGLFFALSEVGLEHAAGNLGRSLQKILTHLYKKTGDKHHETFDSGRHVGSSSKPNTARQPRMAFKDRMERLSKGRCDTMLSQTRTEDKQMLVYGSMLSILATKIRSSASTKPAGICLDIVTSGKVTVSCVGVRSFFDIGQTLSAGRIVNLRIPPTRVDGVHMNNVFDQFKRVIQTRVHGDMYKVSENKSLGEASVQLTINKLCSLRRFGVERVSQVCSDLGGSQRKWWLHNMLAEDSPFPRILYRPDGPHAHHRMTAKMIEGKDSLFCHVKSMVKLMRKLNGTSSSFAQPIGGFNSFKKQVVETLTKNAESEDSLPAPIEYFKKEALRELRQVYFGMQWSDRQVLTNGYLRSTSFSYSNHVRWCGSIYTTSWLADGRWSTLMSLVEMLVSAGKSRDADLAKVTKKLIDAGKVSCDDEFGDVLRQSTFQLIDVERTGYDFEPAIVSGSSDSDDDGQNLFNEEVVDEETTATKTEEHPSDGSLDKKNRDKKAVPKKQEQYQYNVLLKMAVLFRNADAHLQCPVCRHVMRAHLVCHALRVIEVHDQCHSNSASPYRFLHEEVYFQLASALTAVLGTELDDSLVCLVNTLGAHDVAELMGGSVVELFTLCAKANAERTLAAYRAINYGKPRLKFDSDAALRQHERALRILQRYFEAASQNEKKRTASGITNHFAITEASQIVQGDRMKRLLGGLDCYDHNLSKAAALSEVRLHDRMCAIEQAARSGSAAADCVAVGLKRFHRVYTYKEFIKKTKLGLDAKRNSTLGNVARDPDFVGALDTNRDLRDTALQSTRSVEAEGAWLSAVAGTHVGVGTGVPWRVIVSQLPDDVFKFLSISDGTPAQNVLPQSGEGPGAASSGAQILSNGPSGIGNNMNSMKPASSSAKGSSSSNDNVANVAAGSGNAIAGGRMATNVDDLEDYLGDLQWIPPSMVLQVCADDMKQNGAFARGSLAAKKAADVVQDLRGSNTQKGTSRWWSQGTEYSDLMHPKSVSNEAFPTNLTDSFVKWGFYIQSWHDIFYAENIVRTNYDRIMAPTNPQQVDDSLETGASQAMVLKYLRRIHRLLALQRKGSQVVSVLLLSSPSVNTLVLLELDKDVEQKGNTPPASVISNGQASELGNALNRVDEMIVQDIVESESGSVPVPSARSSLAKGLYPFPEEPKNYAFETVNTRDPEPSKLHLEHLFPSSVLDFGYSLLAGTVFAVDPRERKLKIDTTNAEAVCPVYFFLAEMGKGKDMKVALGELQNLLAQMLSISSERRVNFVRALFQKAGSGFTTESTKQSTTQKSTKRNGGTQSGKRLGEVKKTNSTDAVVADAKDVFSADQKVDSSGVTRAANPTAGSSLLASRVSKSSIAVDTGNPMAPSSPSNNRHLRFYNNMNSMNAEPGHNAFLPTLSGFGVVDSSNEGEANIADDVKNENPHDQVRDEVHTTGYEAYVDEFMIGDLSAIRSCTLIQVHRLLCMAYFGSNEAAIGFLISSCGCYAKNKVTYFVETSLARDIIGLKLQSRLNRKRKKTMTSTPDEAENRAGKKARTATQLEQQAINRSNAILLGKEVTLEMGIREGEKRESAMKRKMRPLVPIRNETATTTKEKNKLRARYGSGGQGEQDMKTQRLEWHTDVDLLQLALRDCDRSWNAHCPLCSSEEILGTVHRKWLVTGKGPSGSIYDKNGRFVTTRRLGPRSHLINGRGNECVCGIWHADGSLQVCGSTSQADDDWFNCCMVYAAYLLHEREPCKSCVCEYPIPSQLPLVKATWKARHSE